MKSLPSLSSRRASGREPRFYRSPLHPLNSRKRFVRLLTRDPRSAEPPGTLAEPLRRTQLTISGHLTCGRHKEPVGMVLYPRNPCVDEVPRSMRSRPAWQRPGTGPCRRVVQAGIERMRIDNASRNGSVAYARPAICQGDSVIQRRPALFRGRHFEDVVIVLCVRWYLRYSLGTGIWKR